MDGIFEIDKSVFNNYSYKILDLTNDEKTQIDIILEKNGFNKGKLKDKSGNSVYFTDEEKTILYKLIYANPDKILDITQYTEEELHCLPLFFKAELVTMYPNLGGDGDLQGKVNIKREGNGVGERDLSYILPEKFDEYISNNNVEALNHFTLDSNNNLIIANSTVNTGNFEYEGISDPKNYNTTTMITNTIDYQSLISKYTVPFEFLLPILTITKNAAFCTEIANNIYNNSYIDIKIYDNSTTVVNDCVEQINSEYELKYICYLEYKYKDINDNESSIQPYTYEYIDEPYSETYTNNMKYTTTTNTNTVVVQNAETTFFSIKQKYTMDTLPADIQKNTNNTSNNSPGDWEKIDGFGANISLEGKIEEDAKEEIINNDSSISSIISCDLKTTDIRTYREKRMISSNGNFSSTVTTNKSEYVKDTGQSSVTFKGAGAGGFYDIFAKDDKENDYKSARSYLLEVKDRLFEMFKANLDNPENFINIMKYVFYLYTRNNYGITDAQLKELLAIYEPQEYVSFGTCDATWDNSITKEEFIKIVNNYVPPNGSGAYGTNQEGYNKYFKPNAANFYDIATSKGLDPRLVFSIGILESGWGTSAIANEKGNFFGWNANDSNPYGDASSFTDMSDGINAVCNGITNNYINPDGEYHQKIIDKGYEPSSTEGIGSVYSSDPNWANKVKNIMAMEFNYTPGINGSFLAIAKQRHDYLRLNNFYYYNGTSVPANASKFTGIDCSAYVCDVLYYYGYTEYKGPQKTTSYFVDKATMEAKGWTVMSATQAQAGDIVVRSGHMEIYAGDGKFLNAGATSAMRKEYTNPGVKYLGEFTYAIRVTPPNK